VVADFTHDAFHFRVHALGLGPGPQVGFESVFQQLLPGMRESRRLDRGRGVVVLVGRPSDAITFPAGFENRLLVIKGFVSSATLIRVVSSLTLYVYGRCVVQAVLPMSMGRYDCSASD
jgi:hypothetical protein